VPFFGERPIDKIGPAQVAQHLKRKRSDGLSSKTVQNHLNFLHSVFSFAIKRGWAQSNPVAYVDRRRRTAPRTSASAFCNRPNSDALIDVAPDDTLGSVERVLYLVAALTGLRKARTITFHELRDTFGTQMAAAGAPLRAIQEWMGHADAETTEIYHHYAPNPTRRGVRRAGVRLRRCVKNHRI
jgi:site-specific recombinase XerD